jgi:hypothetical protein
VTKRSLLIVLLAASAAAVVATPATGKEGVEATLDTPVPVNASAGERVRVAWTLAASERGKRQPFGAQGVFVRLLSESGGEATTGFASGDGGAAGKYEATVVVPKGGIGGLLIGLRGIASGPTGTWTSDVYFPVKNNPLPASAPAPAPREAAQARSEGSASTWIRVLVVTALLASGGLAVGLRRRRRRTVTV